MTDGTVRLDEAAAGLDGTRGGKTRGTCDDQQTDDAPHGAILLPSSLGRTGLPRLDTYQGTA
jgi:hypothetical protein